MKKILFILFVTLGVNLQQSVAQNDSVVLPDYMYKNLYPRSGNSNALKINSNFDFNKETLKITNVTKFSIGDKKPVIVNSYIKYVNSCKSGYYLDERYVVGCYCINDNECYIFTSYLKMYKFIYSDSSIIEVNDLSNLNIFKEDLDISYNKAIKEVVDFEKENPGFYIEGTENGCLNTYCKFRGLQIMDIGRMSSGNLVKIDSIWFLSFEYESFSSGYSIRVLLKSNDLKTWTKCKVYLNYKYSFYNEQLKSFLPYLFTYENYDIPLRNVCKINNIIYFSDSDRLIYMSSDGGNTFKLYKVFRPFPEPVIPTFENTNH